MADSKHNNRIEVVLKDPNPLFKKWLKEWLTEAELKDSKSKYKLKEALNSITKFPLPLATGRDCAILRGFGSTLCGLLDKKLEIYKRNNLNEYETSINYVPKVQRVAEECIQIKFESKKQQFETKNLNDNLNFNVKSNNEMLEKEQNSKRTLPKLTPNPIKSQDNVVMYPGTFEIVLLLDTQETSGKYKNVMDDTKQFLNSQNLKYEIRRLSVGDFCWICRDEKQNELILPYIIERKRMDDFASSIRDGRFHEQKFRLKNSKIPNLIYLIENYGSNQHVGLPINTLLQAATNTQIHSGFSIKFSNSHRDSLLYISTLTNILKNKFLDKKLTQISKENLETKPMENESMQLISFSEFQKESIKTKLHIREIFIKQLVQLKSISTEKAFAITEIYPTPRSLISRIKNCTSQEEAEMMLAGICFGKLNRPIGKYISKVIFQFYNTYFNDISSQELL